MRSEECCKKTNSLTQALSSDTSHLDCQGRVRDLVVSAEETASRCSCPQHVLAGVLIPFRGVCVDKTDGSSALMWIWRCPFTPQLDQESPDSTGRIGHIPDSPFASGSCPAQASSNGCLPYSRLTVLSARRLDRPTQLPEALSTNDADGCIGVLLQLHCIDINPLFCFHAFHSRGLSRCHARCVQRCLACVQRDSALIFDPTAQKMVSKAGVARRHTLPRLLFFRAESLSLLR